MDKPCFLVIFAVLFAGFGAVWAPSSAQAQFDIFERRKPPPRRRSFTFGPIRLGGQAGRKQVFQGNTLYEQGNYAAASLKYYRALRSLAGSKWGQAAQYQLAKSLYRMKLYQPALYYFSEIIGTGRKHQHFKSALGWALKTGKQINSETIYLSKMRSFRPSDLPRLHRDELFYRLGRYYFQRSRQGKNKEILQRATDLLLRVRSSSPEYFARARYVVGVSYDTDNQPNSAARAFRSAVKAALRIKNAKVRQNLFELGVMQLGRIHYGAKHFRSATNFYTFISRSSSRWLDALFEMSWAYLRRGKYDRALGILHTLESPYFRNEYYPELDFIRGVSFFQRCRYQDVQQIVKKFRRRFTPLQNTIREFTKRYRNPGRLFRELQRLRRQDAGQGLNDDPSGQMFQRILRLTFKDKILVRMFDYVKELELELERINQSQSSVWKSSPLAGALRRRLQVERKKTIARAGNRARRRFLEANGDLARLKNRMLRLKYEALEAEKKIINKSGAQRGGFGNFSISPSGKKKKTRRNMYTVSTHEDFVYWPFQGEYWVDELGYYRYRLRSECKK